MRRPQSRPYLLDTSAPCVLASHSPSALRRRGLITTGVLSLFNPAFQSGVGLPHRHRALDGLQVVVVELAEAGVHALDELVLRRAVLDDALPFAEPVAELAEMASAVVEDAVVHEGEGLWGSTVEVVDRRGPRLHVDVGWGRRRQDEPARRDPHTGGVARVERAVLVCEADVVRGMPGRGEAF